MKPDFGSALPSLGMTGILPTAPRAPTVVPVPTAAPLEAQVGRQSPGAGAKELIRAGWMPGRKAAKCVRASELLPSRGNKN